jgi:glycosyltransferase involved in cell wall biosynthesis
LSDLRIVFVITGLGTGGAEHMLCKLVEVARSLSVRPMVISLLDEGTLGDRIREAGAEVLCCHLDRPRGLLCLISVFRHVRRFRPDVIQGWMYHGSLFASLLGWVLPGHPAVLWSMRQTLYSLRDEPFRLRIIIRILALFSHKVGGVLYNSRLSMLQHQQAGLRSPRDEMIPNGFDLERYRIDEQRRSQVRAQWGMQNEVPVVGMVARVHPMKDHGNFIAAAGLLAKSLPEVRFVLVGEGTDGPALKALLESAGIAGCTLCLGRIDHTEDIYPALDLLVLSSAWGEGWPNVLGESMACGVACVATDVGESRQIIGETESIVPPRNPQALARACQDLLGLGSTHLHVLGQQARERVLKNFDIQVVFRRHVELWQEYRRNGPES